MLSFERIFHSFGLPTISFYSRSSTYPAEPSLDRRVPAALAPDDYMSPRPLKASGCDDARAGDAGRCLSQAAQTQELRRELNFHGFLCDLQLVRVKLDAALLDGFDELLRRGPRKQ